MSTTQKPEYSDIVVESFLIPNTSGKHGNIHIRPLEDQTPFETSMFVECSKKLIRDYPVGTKFLIKAKITSRENGAPFIYSNYNWKYEVLE